MYVNWLFPYKLWTSLIVNSGTFSVSVTVNGNVPLDVTEIAFPFTSLMLVYGVTTVPSGYVATVIPCVSLANVTVTPEPSVKRTV